MKVSFNNLSLYGNCKYYQGQKAHISNQISEDSKFSTTTEPVKYFAVQFCAKPDSTMLLAQSDKLLCAYSRKPMLSPYTFRSIVPKLAKKTNAQSAINYLKEYREYMPTVETEIFDMFEEYGASGKKTFQDILIEKRPDALVRLRQKQTEVLHSTDDYILSLDDEELADELLCIRDVALLNVNDGTFGRSDVLEQLKNIETNDKNKNKVHEIFKNWYKLPRALKDYDAFVVKYFKFSHIDIAQRLLSMAVASVEHIKPYANGGQDILWNYVLTQMLYNQDKGDMSLSEYDELNPEIKIKENLPKYIDDVCNEIRKGNKYFECNRKYPEQLRQNIVFETEWQHLPEISSSQLNCHDRQIPNSQKGANRYRQNRK